MNRADRMMLPRAILLLTSVVALCALPSSASAVTGTFDQTYPMSAQGKVRLENVNGDVTVGVWDRDEVRVEAVKEAGSAERLAALKIEVEAGSDFVSVETHYPSSGSRWGEDHGRTQVTYTLTVPRNARIDKIDLVNGDLSVEGVRGGVEVESVNGTIELRDVGGELNISTVNGMIKAALGSLDGIKSIDIESVNGAVEIDLAGSASASISAETVNGRIRNNLGIEVDKGKYVGSSMRGSVGGGGTGIDIETVNGKIEINGT